MLAKCALLLLTAGLASISMAADLAEGRLKSASELRILTVEGGCTKTDTLLWIIPWNTEFNCGGVILKDVVVENSSGKDVPVGDVLIYPAGEDLAAIQKIVDDLGYVLSGQNTEGVYVELSNLKYLTTPIALKEITGVETNEDKYLLGGIKIGESVTLQDGMMIYTVNKTIKVGLD